MKYFISLILMALITPTVFAQPAVEELYQNQAANFAGSALQPLAELLSPLVIKLSLLVGGIFGLYLLLILLRVYYERKNMKLLQHIRYNLDQQNQHYGIPSSREKIGFLHKYVLDKLFPTHVQRHYVPFSGNGRAKKAPAKIQS